MHRGFLIDLENVQSSGVDGIEQLTEQDAVLIFYSNKADNLKIDTVKAIHESKAGVEYIKVFNGTPNALDFQLLTYLFYHYDKDDRDAEYWIISKDTGYDAALKMCKRLGVVNVKRAPAIKNAVHYKMKVETIEALKAKRKNRQEEEPVRRNQPECEDQADIEEENLLPEETEETSGYEEAEEEKETRIPDRDADEITSEEGSEPAKEAGEEFADIAVEEDEPEEDREDEEETDADEFGDHDVIEPEDFQEEEENEAEDLPEDHESDPEEIEAEETIEPEEIDTEVPDAEEPEEEVEEPAPDIPENREEIYDVSENQTEDAEDPTETTKEAIRRYLTEECDINADDKVVSTVIMGLHQFGKRGQFYQFFRRHLGGKRGGEVYRKTKDHLMEMRKMVEKTEDISEKEQHND